MTNYSDPNKQSGEVKQKKNQIMFQLLDFGLEFAIMIALPLIIFIYAGKWLDARQHTKYWVIVGILTALALSTFSIAKKINSIRVLMNKNEKSDFNLPKRM